MVLWFVLSPGVSGAFPGVARTDSHPDQRRQRTGEPRGHQLLAEVVQLPKLRDDHRGACIGSPFSLSLWIRAVTGSQRVCPALLE